MSKEKKEKCDPNILSKKEEKKLRESIIDDVEMLVENGNCSLEEIVSDIQDTLTHLWE